MPSPTPSPPEETPHHQSESDAPPFPAPGTTTKALAERHEALWLRLAALHKNTIALGAKKPHAPVSEALRISAEGLLSDCAVFTRKRGERLAVAAPDLSGLTAQLGQALAALESWESRHTTWDERFNCRIWSLHTGYLPIMRLRPPAAALSFKRNDPADMRNKLGRLIDGRQRMAYEEGFAAGRAARQGAPAPVPAPPDPPAPYPRLRRID